MPKVSEFEQALQKHRMSKAMPAAMSSFVEERKRYSLFAQQRRVSAAIQTELQSQRLKRKLHKRKLMKQQSRVSEQMEEEARLQDHELLK